MGHRLGPFAMQQHMDDSPDLQQRYRVGGRALFEDLRKMFMICHCPLPIAISHRRGTKRTHSSSEPLYIQKCKSFEFEGVNFYAFAWFVSHWKGSDDQKGGILSYVGDFHGFWGFLHGFGSSYALEGVQRHLGGKWCGFEKGLVAKEGFMPSKGKPRSKGWFFIHVKEKYAKEWVLMHLEDSYGGDEGFYASERVQNAWEDGLRGATRILAEF